MISHSEIDQPDLFYYAVVYLVQSLLYLLMESAIGMVHVHKWDPTCCTIQ
jgi:hypothetical protein